MMVKKAWGKKKVFVYLAGAIAALCAQTALGASVPPCDDPHPVNKGWSLQRQGCPPKRAPKPASPPEKTIVEKVFTGEKRKTQRDAANDKRVGNSMREIERLAVGPCSAFQAVSHVDQSKRGAMELVSYSIGHTLEYDTTQELTPGQTVELNGQTDDKLGNGTCILAGRYRVVHVAPSGGNYLDIHIAPIKN